MVIVDSSAWIEASRRTGRLDVKCAVEALLDEYEATLCPPVRLEVLGGCRKEERRIMQNAFDILPHVPLLEQDWGTALHNAWKLQEKGIQVPWNDLLIATIAFRQNARIYTLDKHFEQMAPHLNLMLYQPGYGGMYSSGEG